MLGGAVALGAALSGCSSTAAPASGGNAGDCQYTAHEDAETSGGKKGQGASAPVIKGYILNNTNEKVYYLPGSQAYKRVRIDESKGMKYFCTEKEAESAGWKKSTV
jgi:hypothetical protein